MGESLISEVSCHSSLKGVLIDCLLIHSFSGLATWEEPEYRRLSACVT